MARSTIEFGQVRRIAAVARQVQIDAVQAAAGVEAHVVFDIKRVALAGHQHVFDPRQAHLGRLPGEARDHGAQACRAGGLGFLAAKTAAHAAHIDHDVVHRNVKHFATSFCTSVGFWVEQYTIMPPSSVGITDEIWVSR
jgi:hypothetical protein